MKVEFNEDGELTVYAQNNTERVALNAWWSTWNESRGEVGGFSVDAGSYLMTTESGARN